MTFYGILTPLLHGECWSLFSGIIDRSALVESRTRVV